MKQYHVTKPDGSQCGPYDEDTLLSQVKNNLISPDSYVWCEGMAGWEPFKKVFTTKKEEPQPATPQTSTPIQPAKKKGPWGMIIGILEKKGPWGMIIGILVAVLLIIGVVTGWLMMRNPISSDKDLLTYLRDEDGIVFHGEANEKRITAILEELSNDSKEFGYRATKRSIIIMNSGDATEYLLESRGLEKINADDMLEEALELGADKVAEVLIKHGVSVEDDDRERMLGEIIDDAAKLYEPGRWDKSSLLKDVVPESRFKESRNYKRCAQLAVEKLKAATKLDKGDMADLRKLKLLGKESEMVEYVESVILED